MTITWSTKFEIGDKMIDMEHKQLVEKYNGLISACSTGQEREELESALDFLCKYTVKHFYHEELLQLRINYPEYKRHKEIHEAFKVTVADLAVKLKENGPSIPVLVKLNTDIGGWLVNHIRDEDAKIAAYVKR